eukprot:2791976-Prymnesium_polylepis.1
MGHRAFLRAGSKSPNHSHLRSHQQTAAQTEGPTRPRLHMAAASAAIARSNRALTIAVQLADYTRGSLGMAVD